MSTNYESAQILDLAEPRDFICGIKVFADSIDWLIGEFETKYILALDSDDE